MCGRFALIDKPETICKEFGVEIMTECPSSYNIAPSQQGLIIAGRQKLASLMNWGFLPFWAHDKKITSQINAKSESVHEKPMFRNAFKKHRCAIVVSGFYEWDRIEHNGQFAKIPHYFHLKNKKPFLLAGIWDRCEINNTEHVGFAILTTNANKLVSNVHTRMPVILTADRLDDWLNSNTELLTLQKMLQPFRASLMREHEVSTNMNNPKFNGPECIEQIKS